MIEKPQERSLIHQLSDSLGGDIDEAQRRLRDEPSQFNRRSFVRAVFAAVEGLTYAIKQEVLKRGPEEFSAAELAMLREEAYGLDGEGRPQVQSKFVPTDANLRFAVSLFVRKHDPDYRLDVTGAGWAAFKRALQIRHRVTHPKDTTRIAISDAELESVHAATAWFQEAINSALRAINAVLQRQIDHLKSRLAEVEGVGTRVGPLVAGPMPEHDVRPEGDSTRPGQPDAASEGR